MPRRKGSLCCIKGCHEPTRGFEFCSMHYTRWRNNGHPLWTKRAATGDPRKFITDMISQNNLDECLIWPFSRKDTGTPQVNWNGKNTSVPRLVCRLVNGDPADEKMHAAHECGNGDAGCVNPKHLNWKTAKENMADKIIHKTLQKGSRNGKSRLTEGEVINIKRIPEYVPQDKVAKIFGVSSSTIGDIRRGRTWSWLDTSTGEILP